MPPVGSPYQRRQPAPEHHQMTVTPKLPLRKKLLRTTPASGPLGRDPHARPNYARLQSVRMSHAISTLHIELVDEPAFFGHRPEEGVLIELAAEPRERAVRPALHDPEKLQVLLGCVRTVEDRDVTLECQPGIALLPNKKRATRVAPEALRANPALGATAPDLPVDEHDAHPNDPGMAVAGERHHGCRVISIEESHLFGSEGHRRQTSREPESGLRTGDKAAKRSSMHGP